MAIASDRTGTPKRRHGIADSMPAFAYCATVDTGHRTYLIPVRLASRITGNYRPRTPENRPNRVAMQHSSHTADRYRTPATLPQQRKTVCCAEKSLSVGRRLSITGNHGIWRQISTIICRQTRNAPNQACHTSLPAAFAAATSASSWASLASDSPVMNFSTRAFASPSSC